MPLVQLDLRGQGHQYQLADGVRDIRENVARRLELDRQVRVTTLNLVEVVQRQLDLRLHVVGHDIAVGLCFEQVRDSVGDDALFLEDLVLVHELRHGDAEHVVLASFIARREKEFARVSEHGFDFELILLPVDHQATLGHSGRQRGCAQGA